MDEMGEGGQKVQTFSHKLSKSWGCIKKKNKVTYLVLTMYVGFLRAFGNICPDIFVSEIEKNMS